MEELQKKYRLQQINICKLKKEFSERQKKFKEVIFYLYEFILTNLPDDLIEDKIEDIKKELKKVNM